jgi:hypothetical protein
MASPMGSAINIAPANIKNTIRNSFPFQPNFLNLKEKIGISEISR